MIYLDNNATTPMDPAVVDRMSLFLKEHFGNPSSLYPIGRAVKDILNQERDTIAKSIGAIRSEIIFTGSGTESDNFALRGIMAAHPDKTELITSQIEHPGVLETANDLKNHGITVKFVPVDSVGTIDLEFLQNSISEQTALVSIMHANNELGTIQPIEEVVKLAKAKGVLVHTDAVQTFGKIDIDIKELGVDALSISGHKVNGPKGVGALFIKKGTPIHPIIFGGSQEREMRAGTENTSGIVGFGEAVRQFLKNKDRDKKTIEHLTSKLKKGIEERIPKVKFNGHATNRIQGTLNFSFYGLEAEAILLALATKDIYVSTGSACSEDSEEVSHVLSAIGLSPEEARGTLRISIGRFNTEKDIDTTLEELPEIVHKLREISAISI